MTDRLTIARDFNPTAHAVIYEGDCLTLLKSLPSSCIQLIITSPPYNIGKSYEKKSHLQQYIDCQKEVIAECVRVLKPEGSICWQVGNYVDKGIASSIVPLDIALYPVFSGLGLKLRNRIIWHFEHGLHCTKRFSGRYETINWFTKSDSYFFDVNPIRIPQKYPGKKYFKGPKAGEYSCNPLGKNPGDLWTIPNVKNNHVEKTGHPCQYPVELVERFVLSMTREQDWIFDPYAGVGSTVVAAVQNNRRGMGAELLSEYTKIARERVSASFHGTLKIRQRNQPVFDPQNAGKSLTTPPWKGGAELSSSIVRPQKLLKNKTQYLAKKKS